MKKQLRLFTASFFLVLALSVSSFGWNDTGHMAVAFVTYLNLSAPARARVDELIRLNPQYSGWLASIPASYSAAQKRMLLFMIAATWADQIKGDQHYHADGPQGGNSAPTDGTAGKIVGYSDTAMHKYWHFVDQPFNPDGTPAPKAPVPNALTQIIALRAVLSSDGSAPLKSYALVWLLHLVGDIHQPLHTVSRFSHKQPEGDAGGNFVIVCDPQCGSRLHAFWDGLLGTSSSPQIAINAGQALPVPPAGLVNNLDPATWMTESFEDARTTAYKQPPIGIGPGPFTLTTDYRNSARAVAMRRVALAGARLAKILNAELK